MTLGTYTLVYSWGIKADHVILGIKIKARSFSWEGEVLDIYGYGVYSALIMNTLIFTYTLYT